MCNGISIFKDRFTPTKGFAFGIDNNAKPLFKAKLQI